MALERIDVSKVLWQKVRKMERRKMTEWINELRNEAYETGAKCIVENTEKKLKATIDKDALKEKLLNMKGIGETKADEIVSIVESLI